MINQYFLKQIGMKISKSNQKYLISLIDKKLIWAIIPARVGSLRVKNKNLQKINNIELYLYSLGLSKKIKSINSTFISTNCLKIANQSLRYGGICPFLRPNKISGKNSTDTSYISHFINNIINTYEKLPNLIIQLRPTTPFRNVAIIENAISKFMKNYKKYDSLRSSNLISHPPEKIYRIKNNKYVNINLKKLNTEYSNKPAQYFKPTYKPNGYIDIIKTEYFIKNTKIYGDNIMPFITPEPIEIDTYSDLQRAKTDNSVEKKKIIKIINKYA